MRNIVVLEFITLDGVIQAGGGPEEDPSGGFKYGGWQAPYSDETLGNVMAQQMREPFALLLGRKTFAIFASYWPQHADQLARDQRGDEVCRFEHAPGARVEQLRLHQRRRCRRDQEAQGRRWTAVEVLRQRQPSSDPAEA